MTPGAGGDSADPLPLYLVSETRLQNLQLFRAICGSMREPRLESMAVTPTSVAQELGKRSEEVEGNK
ncbi:hypothetical protein VULLAG_LOCUS10067 [Vulpes lagopus]